MESLVNKDPERSRPLTPLCCGTSSVFSPPVLVLVSSSKNWIFYPKTGEAEVNIIWCWAGHCNVTTDHPLHGNIAAWIHTAEVTRKYYSSLSWRNECCVFTICISCVYTNTSCPKITCSCFPRPVCSVDRSVWWAQVTPLTRVQAVIREDMQPANSQRCFTGFGMDSTILGEGGYQAA